MESEILLLNNSSDLERNQHDDDDVIPIHLQLHEEISIPGYKGLNDSSLLRDPIEY